MAFLRIAFLAPQPRSSARGSQFARRRVAGEILGIKTANVRNVCQKPIEMKPHRLSRAHAVAGFDRRRDGAVLGNRAGHAPRLRQGEASIAVDVNLDLLDQRPNSAIARGFGDRAMKGLVRLMEGVAVAETGGFALALEVSEEGDHLAALRPLGGEPR